MQVAELRRGGGLGALRGDRPVGGGRTVGRNVGNWGEHRRNPTAAPVWAPSAGSRSRDASHAAASLPTCSEA